jgi:hypothetical protein
MTNFEMSSDASVSSREKTDRYDITEILLTVMLNTITLNPNSTIHKIFKYIDQSNKSSRCVFGSDLTLVGHD